MAFIIGSVKPLFPVKVETKTSGTQGREYTGEQ